MRSPAHPKCHLLTVLVEDYFQVGAFEKLIQERNWANFATRYENNTLKALDLLDQFDTKATFFVLGWIAEQNPGLVHEIASRGHEIASRGYYHRSLKNLTPDEFREDLRRTNHALELASGQKVIGYRSAEKLEFGRDKWVLDELASEGFVYDASFMPSRRDDRVDRFAREVKTAEQSIWEFPYSTVDLGIGLLPISGGNYIRQIPFSLLKHAITNWDRSFTQPFVFYFHVWELDPEQPRISAATYLNRIRHYRKLDKMGWVIRENLRRYQFSSVAAYLGINDQPVLPESIRYKSDKKFEIRDPHPSSDSHLPVSIVIPCYNECEALPYLANTLRGVEMKLLDAGYRSQFLFVDDGSTDSTLEKLNELFGTKKNVKFVRHDTNMGVAAAIFTGLKSSETEIVCSMDCDCTYDPLHLVDMLPLLDSSTDMVTASPYHREGEVRNVPGWRLFLSKGASFLYRRTLNTKLFTYTSCFRVYRRDSVIQLDMQEGGFLGVAEMLGKLDLAGGKIVEYPATLEVRLFGASKMKTAKTIVGHLRLLSRLGRLRFFGKTHQIKPSLPRDTVKTESKERERNIER